MLAAGHAPWPCMLLHSRIKCPFAVPCPPLRRCNGSDPLVASCTSKLGFARVWPRQVCGAHEYGTQDLRQLLKDKHIAILGDSHGRHLFTWLVRMLDGACALGPRAAALCCCRLCCPVLPSPRAAASCLSSCSRRQGAAHASGCMPHE